MKAFFHGNRCRQFGVTLIEVMVALVVLAVVVIGAATFFSTGRGTVANAARRRVAAQIAHERLELARAGGYAALANGNGTVAVGGTTYTWALAVATLQADPADGGSAYKRLEVTVTWPQSGPSPVVVRSAMAP